MDMRYPDDLDSDIHKAQTGQWDKKPEPSTAMKVASLRVDNEKLIREIDDVERRAIRQIEDLGKLRDQCYAQHTRIADQLAPRGKYSDEAGDQMVKSLRGIVESLQGFYRHDMDAGWIPRWLIPMLQSAVDKAEAGQ